MTEGVRVTVERRFEAAPERVFDAWLDPAGAGSWLFATPDGEPARCEIDARVGGRFRFDERRGGEVAEHFGEYLEIDPPRRLVFTFATSFAPDAPTRVAVTVAPDGNGSRVTLEHDGVWPDHAERTRTGWAKILDQLARALT